MNKGIYRYRVASVVPFQAVEESLLLAVFAAESLHGAPQVRLDASFNSDPEQRACVVDATTEVGGSIARIFTGFLSREFGEDNFWVERVEEEASPRLDEPIPAGY